MNASTRHLTIVLLAAITTAATAAGDAPADQRVEVTASRVALAAAETVLSRGDLDATYDMSSGRTVTVMSSGDAVRMRYGRRSQTVLRHDGQGRFVSGDGLLSLEFELDQRGDPHVVRLSMPGDWL